MAIESSPWSDEDRGCTLSAADYKYWYDRGRLDAKNNKPTLDFTGDDVPADWTPQDIAERRTAYDDGYNDESAVIRLESLPPDHCAGDCHCGKPATFMVNEDVHDARCTDCALALLASVGSVGN